MTKAEIKKQVKEAREKLWRQGDLTWLLEPHQKELYDSFHNLKEKRDKIVVWICHRRSGKSYTLVVIAFETAIKIPKALIKYSAPQQDQVLEILDEIIPEILKDCPKDMRPHFVSRRNTWYFPNGSKIKIVGVGNKRYSKLRGGSSDLCLVDEAGFTDDLKKVVNGTLLPTTTTKGGKILLATTPPEEVDHEFNSFREQAEEDENLVIKTIDDYFDAFKKAKKVPKRITVEEMADIIKSYGGVESLEFQREFMCVAITDQTRQIIPEFNLYTEKRIITEVPKPDYYDAYTSMDVGGADLTGILFAYYDFLNNRVVIEDEGVIERQDAVSDNIANMVAEKEAKNWYDPIYNNTITPYKRVADNNNVILLNDLKHLHGIKFSVTEKKEKLNAINQVKLMIKNEQILINPRCVNLINHLRHGKWNKNRTDFARSSKYGHYDLVSSLIYLIRNINFNRNPFPNGYIPNYGSMHSAKENRRDNHNSDIMKTLFLRKNQRK